MSNYKAIIRNSNESFYALVVRVEADGFNRVCNGYKGRHFANRKNAERSTAKYIAQHCS